MIIGVQLPVVTFAVYHFVGIRRERTSWMTSTTNWSCNAPFAIFGTCLHNRVVSPRVQEPEFMIGCGCRSLHQCQSPNEVRIVPDGGAGDREVLSAARSEWTPQYASREPPGRRADRARCACGSSLHLGRLDSGFSGRLFDADKAAPISVFSANTVTDGTRVMPHAVVRRQGIGRGLTLVRDVRNTDLHPV